MTVFRSPSTGEYGKPDEAEQIYRQAIQQNSHFSPTHFKLALALAIRQKALALEIQRRQQAKQNEPDLA